MGLNPMSPKELQRRGWLAGWFLPIWHALDDAGVPIGPQPQPAPRILEGRFTDDGAVYSYFHPDPTTTQRHAGPSERLGLYFPNFSSDEAREIQMDHVANGVVIVAAGHHAASGQFMAHCRSLVIEDEWTTEHYVRRSHHGERIRSVAVQAPDFDMRLRYDYKLNRVLERNVCGLPCVEPSARSSVRFVTETVL